MFVTGGGGGVLSSPRRKTTTSMKIVLMPPSQDERDDDDDDDSFLSCALLFLSLPPEVHHLIFVLRILVSFTLATCLIYLKTLCCLILLPGMED